jgi:predicted dehydrogenase
MQNIIAAVIGLGSNGMRSIPDVQASEHVAKVIAVDTQEALRSKARAEYGVDVASSAEEVIADPAVDLIYISTPNNSHCALGQAALEHGKKVFMEKPMGISRQETEAILDTVRRTGGWLQVGFECRNYSHLYVRIKEILDAGEIGTLRHINCQYILPPFGDYGWRNLRSNSGGLFMEKLCHYVDLPRWWVGGHVSRYCVASAANICPYSDFVDNVEATYQFKNGVVSHLTFIAGLAADRKPNVPMTERGFRLCYQLIGSSGALEANAYERQLKVFQHEWTPGRHHGRTAQLARTETWDPDQSAAYVHNTHAEKRDVADRVATGLPPKIDPTDAAETMRLCYDFEDAATAAAAGDWGVPRSPVVAAGR